MKIRFWWLLFCFSLLGCQYPIGNNFGQKASEKIIDQKNLVGKWKILDNPNYSHNRIKIVNFREDGNLLYDEQSVGMWRQKEGILEIQDPPSYQANFQSNNIQDIGQIIQGGSRQVGGGIWNAVPCLWQGNNHIEYYSFKLERIK